MNQNSGIVQSTNFRPAGHYRRPAWPMEENQYLMYASDQPYILNTETPVLPDTPPAFSCAPFNDSNSGKNQMRVNMQSEWWKYAAGVILALTVRKLLS